MGTYSGNSQTSLPKPPNLDKISPIKLEPKPGERELPEPDEAGGKIKLGVVVGHTREAQGAQMPSGLSEYLYNTDVARLMHNYAKTTGRVDVEIIFRDGVGLSGAYAKALRANCDCVIELHFNAFNKTAAGSETLSTTDSRDQEFAKIVQSFICGVFTRTGQSRGVRVLTKTARGGSNIYSFPSGPNCLVEPFFGDNPVEADMAMKRKQAYANHLVDAVIQWGRVRGLIQS